MNDPAVAPLQQAVDALLARDPHALSDGSLLVSTEQMLTVRSQLDGLITAQLQVMDSRHTTVAECGRAIRAGLTEEQHLSQTDASRYLTVARISPFRPSIGDTLRAGRITSEHARVIATGVRHVRSRFATHTSKNC